MPKDEQPVTSNSDSSDAHENEVDYIIVNDSPNVVSDAAHKRNERLNDDVGKRDEANGAARDENSDFIYTKKPKKSLPDLSERQENDANLSEENFTKENEAQDSKKGDDIMKKRLSKKAMIEMKT